MTERTTLHITVGEFDPTVEAQRRVAAAERGELADATDEPTHVLNFEDTETLGRVLRPANLDLVRVIARHEPASMRETADLVGRDVSDVHRNLTELAAVNVIELVTDGQAKRPVARFDDLEVHVPLTEPAPTEDPTAA